MKKILILFYVLVSLFFFPLGLAAEVEGEDTKILEIFANKKIIPRYEKLELDLVLSASYENPFDPDEINLYCEFLSPTGRRLTVPGFLYTATFDNKEFKDKKWQIRFAPDEEGKWEYKVYLKTKDGQDETELDNFRCVKSLNKGFVRISKIDPEYFEFDNGQFYYPLGENICWARLSGFKKYFSQMHKVGGNWSRVWMSSWEVALEWTGKGYEGLGLYNLKKAEKLDDILEIAQDNDIYIQLVINHHGQLSTAVNPQWKENPYNIINGGPCKKPLDFFTNKDAKKLFKNRLRYIVARWGYSRNILAWELWNELTFVDDFDSVVDYIWHKEMSEYLKQIDAAKHLVTTSYAGTLYDYSLNPDVWSLINTIDFTQFHMYTPEIVEAVNGAYRVMSSFNKPYFMAEFGRGTEDGTDKEDREGVNLHAGLWSQFMTPSAGNAMCWWWDSYIHPKQLYYHWQALNKFGGGLDRRLKDYKFSIAKTKADTAQGDLELYIQGILNNQEAYLWVFDLAWTKFSPQRKDALMIKDTPLKLDGMCSGTYLVEYWDTYKGNIIEAEKIESPGGELELVVPDFQKDVAVKVNLVKLESLNKKEPSIVNIVALKTKTSSRKITAKKTKKQIKIDASLSDWPIEDFPSECRGIVSPEAGSFVNKGEILNESDSSAIFYLLFDERYIYLAAEVKDDSVVGSQRGIDIWRDDCLEVWIDTENKASEINNMPFNPACYQINLAPVTCNRKIASAYVYRNFNTPLVMKHIKVKSKITKDGYIIEAAIPLASLYGLDIKKNSLMGFNLSVVDRDEEENKWNHMLWVGENEDDASSWGELQLIND